VDVWQDEATACGRQPPGWVGGSVGVADRIFGEHGCEPSGKDARPRWSDVGWCEGLVGGAASGTSLAPATPPKGVPVAADNRRYVAAAILRAAP